MVGTFEVGFELLHALREVDPYFALHDFGNSHCAIGFADEVSDGRAQFCV